MGKHVPSKPQKLHRSEYVKHVAEMAEQITRCSIQPRVPPKFKAIAQTCAPDQATSCLFETVKIEDMEYDYKAKEFGRAKDWDFIGCGMGRCTFSYAPKCVVKFARSGRRDGKIFGKQPWWGAPDVTGEDQNTYEVATYNQAEDRVKELLVPVVAHAPNAPYKWIALPKVQNKDADDFDAERADELVNYLESELPRRNAECRDIHEGNVGILEGNPVMLDYGFGLICKRGKLPEKVQPVLGEFISTHVGSVEAAKQRVAQKHAERAKAKEIEPWVRNAVDILRSQAVNYKLRGGTNAWANADFLSKEADRILADKRIRTTAPRAKIWELLDTQHQKWWNELSTKPPTGLKKSATITCTRESDCPVSKSCVEGKCKTPTDSDVLRAVGIAVGLFNEVPPMYRYEIQSEVDDSLDKAEKAKNRGDRILAMFEVQTAKDIIKEQKDKLKEIGVTTWKPELTKHKGRHGLKRPRGLVGGELTQKRRILWQRAGELRRNAKKLPSPQANTKRALIDEARFLEQQAWHYQTKQMRRGRAPVSDPQKMLAILKPEQRKLFEGEMAQVMSKSALQEFGMGGA